MCRCPEKPGMNPGTQRAVNHTLRGPQREETAGADPRKPLGASGARRRAVESPEAGAEALQEIGGLRPREP